MPNRLIPIVFTHYDNKNSLTRDELANERSFLSYMRCSTSLLISSFSITQVILQHIILLVVDIINDEDVEKNINNYSNAIDSYKSFIKPVCIFICSISFFTICLGLKKSWLNFYNLAERAKFQSGFIGMGILFISIFIIDVIILRQCIVLGSSDFSIRK